MCQGVLKWGITTNDGSMAVMKVGEIHRASGAARLALAGTGGVAGMIAAAIRLVPLGIRDGIYREIARRSSSTLKTVDGAIPGEGMV